MSKPKNEPPKKYQKQLRECKTKGERIAAVRQAMEDGHSNKTAAKALGTTPGVIAGIRFKEKIPSTHRSTHERAKRRRKRMRGERKTPKTKTRGKAAPEPAQSPQPEPEPQSNPPPERTYVSESTTQTGPEPAYEPPPRSPPDMTLRFAGSDFEHQCRHFDDKGKQCGLLQVPGESYCPEHLPLHPKTLG